MKGMLLECIQIPLHELNWQKKKDGVLLVFDEETNGFCLDCGGAQVCFGVTPDLATSWMIIHMFGLFLTDGPTDAKKSGDHKFWRLHWGRLGEGFFLALPVRGARQMRMFFDGCSSVFTSPGILLFPVIVLLLASCCWLAGSIQCAEALHDPSYIDSHRILTSYDLRHMMRSVFRWILGLSFFPFIWI
jgi:hypothetical protein